MEINASSHAGTLESSDVFVEVEPLKGEVRLEIDSVVYEQFGRSLEAAARDVLNQFGVTGAKVTLKDRGALECTVRARVETAIRRAGGDRA